MGATYIQGVGIRFSPMPRADLRYAQRHIEKQTGLLLDEPQVESLWRETGRRGILGEQGLIRHHVCIALVDCLTNRLLGIDWPLNGYEGEDGMFFHNFTAAAVEGGYKVARPRAA